MTEGIHHQTKKGADLAIARREISQESHAAIMAGSLSLAQARDLGRDRVPDVLDDSTEHGYESVPKPTSHLSKNDRSRGCMCGCGTSTKGRFAMGHDQVLLRYAYEHLRGQRDLSDEQLSYVRDETNKLDRAKARILREDEKAAYVEDKRREREAAKTSEQHPCGGDDQ